MVARLMKLPDRVGPAARSTSPSSSPVIAPMICAISSSCAISRVRQRFGIPVEVMFGALDNAPHEIVLDSVLGHRYQRALPRTLAASGSSGCDRGPSGNAYTLRLYGCASARLTPWTTVHSSSL